tara:strand:- start:180 stop:395 length:216 start_codon:yes stop_codon:yes gene_type:complete
MKKISIFLKNIRNLLPYILLIAIYFFFVNLEASNDKIKKLNSEKEAIFKDDKSTLDDNEYRIRIPVIPYDQ